MAGESEFLEMFGRKVLPRPSSSPAKPSTDNEKDADEERCSAFGYLRGLHEKALQVQFRLRDGNSEFFPYAVLSSWRHNPSVGILLKYTGGDVVNLVLIQGSNLDALVNDTINLTDRGLQRQRIVYVREMDEDELKRAGPHEPTIDRIHIAEFESNEELQKFLKKSAPAFVR